MEKVKISLFSLGKFMIAMCTLLLSIACLLVIIYTIISDTSEEPVALLIFVIVGMCVGFFVLFSIFCYFLSVATTALIINDKGLSVENFIFKLYFFEWNEVEDIYILDFPQARKYWVPGLIRGGASATHKAPIYRYFKYPEKWIVIDIGRRSPLHLKDNNVKLQFLLSPINANSVIKFKYNDECLKEISKFYTNYQTNKGDLREVKSLSFNITDKLKDSKNINDFYEFLKMLDVGDKDAVKLLDKYILPEFYEIWLKIRQPDQE